MKIQTPYYVIHMQELDVNFRKLKDSLEKHWSNYIIGYSYKTNALPWLAKHFDKLGCYAEVVSEDEYKLAQRLGVAKDKIIYNGPIKTKETFLEAIENDCIVNIDSQREIEWLEDVKNLSGKIGLRINFDIEKNCPTQSQCGDEGGRFGFCYENGEFERALKKVQAKGIKVVGLHLHTSSKTRGLDIYKTIAETACEVSKRYNLQLEYVDIGGGFFGGLPNKPQFEEYFELVGDILRTQFNPKTTTLVIEPGMAVVGAPISYVTTVIDVKDTTYNRFVITDGTRTSLDPQQIRSSYFHSYKRQQKREVLPRQVICGYTCMEHDRLFVSKDEEELCVGDKIIYHKVGAYTMCLTPLFIKYFPAVFVEEESGLRQVREAWTPEEYIQKSWVEEE